MAKLHQESLTIVLSKAIKDDSKDILFTNPLVKSVTDLVKQEISNTVTVEVIKK